MFVQTTCQESLRDNATMAAIEISAVTVTESVKLIPLEQEMDTSLVGSSWEETLNLHNENDVMLGAHTT